MMTVSKGEEKRAFLFCHITASKATLIKLENIIQENSSHEELTSTQDEKPYHYIVDRLPSVCKNLRMYVQKQLDTRQQFRIYIMKNPNSFLYDPSEIFGDFEAGQLFILLVASEVYD